MDKLVIALLDRVNELHENGAEDVTGVRTGFYDLDRMTAGLQKGDLIVLAARPSMGKTAFALEHRRARGGGNEGLPVLVFSMEMGASQLALRMVGSLGRIDQSGCAPGAQGPGLGAPGRGGGPAEVGLDLHRRDAGAELGGAARARTPHGAPVRRHAGADRRRLPAADERQRSGSDENRATEIGEISRGLKALAKELQCPVIALSQLNRSVETRNDKRPMMSDLRESGAIEQDADVIMFIYRDEYYNKDSKEPGVAEIVIGKQRNGPVGTVKLTFLKPLTKFDNLAPGSMGSIRLLTLA
jgi:replicative DNA helicase